LNEKASFVKKLFFMREIDDFDEFSDGFGDFFDRILDFYPESFRELEEIENKEAFDALNKKKSLKVTFSIDTEYFF
jgi:hypothetical protein